MIKETGLGWPATDSESEEPTGLGWPTTDLRPGQQPTGAVAHAAGRTDSAASDSAESAGEGTANDSSREDAGATADKPPAPADDVAPNVSRETEARPRPRVLTAAEIAATAQEELVEVDTPIAMEAHAAIFAATRRGPLPKPDHTRVLVVANQKGGVGKTTTTVNIAAALGMAGLRTLVVDLDPQGNASTALGVDHHREIPSVYDVLIEGMPLREIVHPAADVNHLFCAPATIELAGAEIELVSVVARESRLRRSLQQYLQEEADGGAAYDYVFIDCPPSLGLLTVNALVGGDEVLIPIQCEYYALEGLTQLLRNVNLVKSHLNPTLEVTTILLTMYDARTRLAAQVADEVRAHFGDTALSATIPRSVRISEAPSYGQSVITYDPTSSGALSYLEAAAELAHRGASSTKQPVVGTTMFEETSTQREARQ